jgi:hypothetical protein
MHDLETLDATELAKITELDARLELIQWSAGGTVNCPTGGGSCSVGGSITGTF